MIFSKTKLLITLIIFVSLFTNACDNVTQENYEKIKAGMKYEEVTDILGKAQECNSAIGMTNCRWGGDEKYIQIQFVADKVVLFSGKGLS
jgi:hypothetical protein